MAGKDFERRHRIPKNARERDKDVLPALSISPDDQVIPVYDLITVFVPKPRFDFRGM